MKEDDKMQKRGKPLVTWILAVLALAGMLYAVYPVERENTVSGESAVSQKSELPMPQSIGETSPSNADWLVSVCTTKAQALERQLQGCALGRHYLCNAARTTVHALAHCGHDGHPMTSEPQVLAARMAREARICVAVKKGLEEQLRDCALGKKPSCGAAREMEKDFDTHCDDASEKGAG